jgi:anti-sigma regulatory factor (Ser/Thr protein kinase)
VPVALVIDDVGHGEIVELEIPARPEVVSVARLVIGALAAADPLFDDERSADLRLAVSEACTNAIQAELQREACTGVPGPPVLMRCRLDVGSIEVTITDHAGGFDPSALRPHPDVTDPARLDHEGGLGIPLIRMLADEVSFVAEDDGTTIVMRFDPRPPSSGEAHR